MSTIGRWIEEADARQMLDWARLEREENRVIGRPLPAGPRQLPRLRPDGICCKEALLQGAGKLDGGRDL